MLDKQIFVSCKICLYKYVESESLMYWKDNLLTFGSKILLSLPVLIRKVFSQLYTLKS